MKRQLRHARRMTTFAGTGVMVVTSVLFLPGPVAHAAGLAMDVNVSLHQTTAATSISSPTFSTHQTNELLLAFVMSDGPSGTGKESFSSVTGGGLAWILRARANGQPGTAEVWRAVAPAIVTTATVKATRASGSYVGAIDVVSFTGANVATNGAIASNSAP